LAETVWVELGRVGSPFGVKGWVRVESWTDPAPGILDYPLWHLRMANGERSPRRLEGSEMRGGKLVVRLEGITDRNAAARLSGATIEVERSRLPPAGARQYYRADLIGLKVRNLEQKELGVVSHFAEGVAYAVMVVQGTRQHWVPATPEFLRSVDLEAGVVQVDWPAELS
jgi:16S rRNA processing protein RimM